MDYFHIAIAAVKLLYNQNKMTRREVTIERDRLRAALDLEVQNVNQADEVHLYPISGRRPDTKEK